MDPALLQVKFCVPYALLLHAAPAVSRLIECPLAQEGPREQWEAISDLDSFFSRVYAFYHEKGLRCILLTRIVGLLMLGFTILFTVFLTEVLNWHDLLHHCYDEKSCNGISPIRPHALERPSPFLVLYLGLFTIYWLWTLLHFFLDLRPLLEMRAFFREKLHIDDVTLQARGAGDDERMWAWARSPVGWSFGAAATERQGQGVGLSVPERGAMRRGGGMEGRWGSGFGRRQEMGCRRYGVRA